MMDLVLLAWNWIFLKSVAVAMHRRRGTRGRTTMVVVIATVAMPSWIPGTSSMSVLNFKTMGGSASKWVAKKPIHTIQVRQVTLKVTLATC